MGSLKILIPNSLTFLRLLLGIGIIWIIFAKNSSLTLQLAGILLLFALLLDLIDGPIARRLDAVTNFGYYLDHIVDFFLLVPIFFVLLKFFGVVIFSFFVFLEIGVLFVSLLKVWGKILEKWPNNPGRISFGILGLSTSFAMLFFTTSFYWKIVLWPITITLIVAILLRFISLYKAISSWRYSRRPTKN